ncbi:hypothetical protein DE146DRAFT_427539 [Phaeosphaeria sp. MPI-PUGE-AT-0046c]|nr:hypothetical protein DE146DRAFT_427539 [Phaeosphaeria sp. MPI-PUGE-AT-0046c]
MAAATSNMPFASHQPSPLARTTSPFKDPRTPPSTPGATAQLWDQYEKRAVENARRRERNSQTTISPQRSSASDISRSSATVIASARSSFDFKFRSRATTSPSTTVAICKTCKQPIAYGFGICEPCKKTIILSSVSGEATPPLSPVARNFATADLQELHRILSKQQSTSTKVTSPKRRSFCPMPTQTQMLDPPIRLSSLRPPPDQEFTLEPSRTRKASLTDPNEPLLRLQIASATYDTRTSSHPTSPTYPPATPPSRSHSRTSSTRPCSLKNTVTPLSPAVHIPTHPYTRHHSVTPSELSSLYPYTSRSASINTNSLGYQGHATSAWDDWDSDEEGKAGLVGLMKSIGKTSKKKERSDSLESVSVRLERAREEERKKSRESRRGSRESEGKEDVKGGKKKKRPSGFVRAISCGACSGED